MGGHMLVNFDYFSSGPRIFVKGLGFYLPSATLVTLSLAVSLM